MRKKLSIAIAAILLAMCLAPSAALAQDAVIALVGDSPAVLGNSAQVQVKVHAPTELTNVSMLCTGMNFYFQDNEMGSTIPAGTDTIYNADLSISPYLPAGSYSVNVVVFYTENGKSKQVNLGPLRIVKSTPAIDSSGNISGDENIQSNDMSAVILNPLEESPVVSGKPGDKVKIKLNLYNRSALMLSSVQITPKVSTNPEEYPFSITDSGLTRHIGSMYSGKKTTVTFDMTVAPNATNGTKTITFTVGYIENGKYLEYPITVYFNVVGAAASGEDAGEPLIIASKDASGKTVTTPTGDVGDTISLKLPLKNRSGGTVTNVEVYPQLSADVSSFPFVIGEVSYDRTISSIKAGETVDVSYSFKIASKATSGVKAVKFSVIYRDATGVAHQTELTSYVNIRKGYTEPEGTIPGVTPPVVQPKIMIASYEAPNPLYAGDEFVLSLNVKNPTTDEEVKNLKLTFSNSDGAILPAEGGSNTLFITKLAPGEEETVQIPLQASADAEAKSHVITIASQYNNANGNAFESSDTISLPVKQRMRVTMNDPVIYVDGATVGTPFYGSVTFFNKGKSQLYNVSMKLESEGDTMRFEEGYYGGNMQSGAQSSADFSIIPSQAGDLFGTLVLTYEDAEGEVYELRKDFSVYIQDTSSMGDPGMDGGMIMPDDGMYPVDGDMGGDSGGFPTWAWFAIGGVVVLALVIVLVKVKKAKREKELEAE